MMMMRLQSLLLTALVALPCFLTVVTGFQVPERSRTAAFTNMLKHETTLSPTKASTESSSTAKQQLPPVLQNIADDQAEYQLNVGRAMDTLRRDMPEILSKTPDFSIYHEDISVIDPSGVQLTGLTNYKSAFAFLQTFQKFWFQNDDANNGLQFRMVYDFFRASIRISWHVVLIPKFPLFGSSQLNVDGISYYQLDRGTGKILEHKIETLVMNNTPVAPPFGILSLLQQDAMGMRQQQQRGVLGSFSADMVQADSVGAIR